MMMTCLRLTDQSHLLRVWYRRSHKWLVTELNQFMLSVFDNGVSGVIRQQLGYLRTLSDTTQLMLFWSTVRPKFCT